MPALLNGACLLLLLLVALPGQAEGNDLSLDPIMVTPKEPEKGDRIAVVFVVENQGDKVDQVLVEGRVNNRTLLSRTISVEADNATALTFSFELDSTVAIITVVVDPYQEVNDTDRTNNHQVHAIEVEEKDKGAGMLLVIVGLAVLGGGLVAYMYVIRTSSVEGSGAEGQRPAPGRRNDEGSKDEARDGDRDGKEAGKGP